jgi:hypothetical protein
MNAGFDLGLRPHAPPVDRSRQDRRIRELSVQGLLGARAGDAALVLVDAPDAFRDYLESRGVPVPRLLRPPDLDPDTRFRPFGWSAEAMELNRRHRRPTDHPPLSVIRRVNSRSYGVELERELFPEIPAGAVVEEISALEEKLSETSPTGEWVVKGEFGNAGLANRRMHSRELSAADRRFVEELLLGSDRVVVEPWLPRERDWSVVFEVPFEPATLRTYETFHTRDGALIGALMEPEDEALTPWPDALSSMAERVASRLFDEGYFGSVCADALAWRDGSDLRLRPLVDLNCRRPMSDVAYRLWHQVAPDRVFYYRFFNRRKLTLPRDLPAVVAALGSRGYDRVRRRGILLASPLEHAKLGMIFVGENRREAFALEADLRARFES